MRNPHTLHTVIFTCAHPADLVTCSFYLVAQSCDTVAAQLSTQVCCDRLRLLLTLSGLSACRQLIHGSQGPLQGLLNTIMEAAERSPQLIGAAAVHLCGLWVQYPAQALHYLDIWETLLLYGGSSAAPQHPVRPFSAPAQ